MVAGVPQRVVKGSKILICCATLVVVMLRKLLGDVIKRAEALGSCSGEGTPTVRTVNFTTSSTSFLPTLNQSIAPIVHNNHNLNINDD